MSQAIRYARQVPLLRISVSFLASWALACERPASPPFSHAEFPSITVGRGAIQGGVHDLHTGRRIAGALIIVQCTCLDGPREARTDAQGIYSFGDLPPGTYTVQALYKRGEISKTVVLSATARATISFAVDPERPAVPVILE